MASSPGSDFDLGALPDTLPSSPPQLPTLQPIHLLPSTMEIEPSSDTSLRPTEPAAYPAFTFDLSSDPLTGQSAEFSAALHRPAARGLLPAEFSASQHRLTPLLRKRGPPDSTQTRTKEPRTQALGTRNQEPSTQDSISTRSKILEARDLLVQAYTFSKSRDEQARLLDLLEIFREYTERGKLQNTSHIIASQVANLESAARKIENRARTLNTATMPGSTTSLATSTTQPPSFATIAATKTPNSTTTEWTQVGKKPNHTKARLVNNKPTKSNRLILVKSAIGTTTDFSPLALRNAFNKAFADKGVKGPVITTVSKTLNQNIVVTTTSSFSAQYLLDKQSIWEHLISFKSAQLDEPWHKVVLHGIPTADFNTTNGMNLVIDEIKTFNNGLTPIGTPYWLTSPENRLNQRAGSVVVAFATTDEANRAIRHRLYIAGISVRVEKLYSTASSTQCQKCQGFGHLNSYCRRPPVCKLCSEKHATQQHVCNTCAAKGTRCVHLAPKCANCKEAHTADDKSCEFLLAIKNKATITLYD
jgi:hypothetical protein